MSAARANRNGAFDPAAAEEIAAAILGSPTLFGEALLVNRDRSPRKYWDHQIEDLECTADKIVHQDGRDVGKSINLATIAIHAAFTNAGYQILIIAPLQGQLNNLVEEIDWQIRCVPAIEASIERKGKSGALYITRAPYVCYRFANGAAIHMVPAGHDGGALRSYHVHLILVDEGARITAQAWKALSGCLKAGGKLRIYSNPDGRRDTHYYRFTQDEEFKVFHWPSWLNPDWGPEKERKLIKLHNGKGTPGWQHEVEGVHGAPTYGAFNLEHFCRAQKDKYGFVSLTISGEDLRGCHSVEEYRTRLEEILGPIAGTPGIRYRLGADLGYTNDPTEIVIFDENDSNVLRELYRFHLERIEYPIQAVFLGVLFRLFVLESLGVDRGGNGESVFSELKLLPHFEDVRDAGLLDRLRMFGFGESLVIERNPETGAEKKRNTKVYATDLITGVLQRRQIIFAKEDTIVEDQFTGHRFTRTDRGIIYSKGNDHTVDAVRCLMLARAALGDLSAIAEFTDVLTPESLEIRATQAVW